MIFIVNMKLTQLDSYRIHVMLSWNSMIQLGITICDFIHRVLFWFSRIFVHNSDINRATVVVVNATFNNISVISWWSVLLVEATRVPGENHQPAASHWQTLSYSVVSSTPRHQRDSKDINKPWLVYKNLHLLYCLYVIKV